MSEDQPTSSKTKRKKFYKQPIFWVGVAILIIIISAVNNGSDKGNTLTASDPAAKTSTTPDTTEQQQSTTAPPTITPTAPTKPAETLSQKNAVNSAKDYLNTEAFSHDGLVAQLEYDQFSAADATYGANHSGADWNEQAAKSAKEYLATESFSRGGLITRLEYDKFTPTQATYGVKAVDL